MTEVGYFAYAFLSNILDEKCNQNRWRGNNYGSAKADPIPPIIREIVATGTANMTTAASAAAILPRVHAALMRGEPQAIWKIADRHTRLLWCSLAHADSETCPPLPWEELTDGQRVRLGAAPMVMLNFLRNLSELSDG